MRRPTFSEWVNLIAAIGTVTSAYFALLSVRAANDQIKSSIEVVNRTEKLKYLSEFSTSANESCKALIPPKFIDEVKLAPPREDGSLNEPSSTYVSDLRWGWLHINMKLAIKENEDNRLQSLHVAIKRARTLALWIPDRSGRNNFLHSAYNLHNNSGFPKNLTGYDKLYELVEAYGRCEALVDKLVDNLKND